jgi:GlpG protein
MSWLKVAEVELDLDLSQLVQFLREQELVHRISEERGQQVVWVIDADAVAPLQEMLGKIQCGDIQFKLPSTSVTKSSSAPPGIIANLKSFPVTSALLMFSLIGFTVVELNSVYFFDWLIFLQPQGNQLLGLGETLNNGQIWRLITPIFLHFGIFHIVFNSLWLWDLGRRLEALQGVWPYLITVAVMAMAGNVSQYLWSGNAYFGGMSGVVYGLVGYIAVRKYCAPDPLLNIPTGIIIFMLAWLLICMSGVLELLMSVGIANSAHVGGLIAGMLIGALASLRARLKIIKD